MTDAKIKELKQSFASALKSMSFGVAIGVAGEAIELAETLTAQLSVTRDAGDEEVERVADDLSEIISEMEDGTGINVQVHANGLVRKLRDIAISRGQQRDEVVGLLKWIRNRMYLDFEDFERDAENPEYNNSIRILEIVEGK